MSKFEEYELYAGNKNFLLSDKIITFTDRSGKLMALRPDVTLSIVKNTAEREPVLRKLYYNENVYRPSNGGHDFSERMQMGLECIGPLDAYALGEVVFLAEKSLQAVSGDYCLSLSHMGFLSGLLEEQELSEKQKSALLTCLSQKNASELSRLCKEFGLKEDYARRLIRAASLFGKYDQTIAGLKELSCNQKTQESINELESIYRTVQALGAGEGLYLDFSVVNDMDYYNGVIFQGYVKGVPAGILSGGRYDSLLQKYGKKSGGAGFALYLDLLEQLEENGPPDAGILLLTEGETDPVVIANAVRGLIEQGTRVQVQQKTPEKTPFGKQVQLKKWRAGSGE